MLLHFPQFRALCVAEDATHTLHNLYTLRGAEVRDAAKWWKTLQQAIELFGDQTDVVFAQHHWPKWGRSGVLTFLEKQRDLYKFIHDQSLRLMNQGYTSAEIAEMLELPPSLASEWYNRGYYGSVRQNAKAVYQKYLGWYDGNPAHLDPLPPEPAARRYVEYMGGAAAVIERARQSFAAGDYRWTAEVMNHVVFAEPHNAEARRLAADALERLGYQTENATWRNEYLAGAYELRHGIPRSVRTTTFSPSMLQALTLDMYFDVMGVMLDGQKATGKKITLNWTFPDVGQKYALVLQNSALTYTSGKHLPSADATITLSRATLDAISLHRSSLLAELLKGKIHIHGNPLKARELFELLDTFDPMFPIVTP
jgi:alkyl sulfatase BDS1-like metallo-beta-lactamase superfamily hydrolase